MRSALYTGHVVHTRHTPVHHAFRHRLWMFAIDLDELPQLSRRLPLFGSNRRALVAVNSRDHLGDPALPIRENVRRYLALHGVDLQEGRVLMLTQARHLGYLFNPVSLFFCHDTTGALRRVIAEVQNTFGERHCYLLDPDADGGCGHDKEFYVSPFLTVAGRYRMSLPMPHRSLRIGMALDQDGRERFNALLTGVRRPLDGRHLLAILLRHPLMTFRITALIHWQALRLFKRRVALVPRPAHIAQEGVS